ncbi:ORF6N domain-containing protein, partial [Waltera sp.]
SMLASVLHSEVAIKVSIGIMRAFVEMRRFIANNALLFERISNVELKQLEYQKQTDEKLDQIFEYISDHEESNQKVFFDGQIYDAFSLIVSLIQKAEKEIVLIDGYVDIGTLNLLTKKNENVTVVMYTLKRTKLSQEDVNNFNSQYPLLEVRYTKVFHDRFLILDKKNVYHIGASLKDAGKKCFGISLIEDAGIVRDILQRLEIETEE